MGKFAFSFPLRFNEKDYLYFAHSLAQFQSLFFLFIIFVSVSNVFVSVRTVFVPVSNVFVVNVRIVFVDDSISHGVDLASMMTRSLMVSIWLL